MQIEKNKRLAILLSLIIVAIIVWVPKGKRGREVRSKPTSTALEKAIPQISPAQRKRTEFTQWGRNPFVWPGAEVDTVTDLTLTGIVWDKEASYAIISGEVVHSGDEIAGKVIRRIEKNRVILSDDLNEYILSLP